MSIKVAINGYGRIGRNVLRALFEANRGNEIEIVAINDLGGQEINAHLTRFDTTHGPFHGEVRLEEKFLVINGQKIALFSERDPTMLPWGALGIDVVMECTGIFASREKASKHLAAGAKKVLISAPASDSVDATIVYGVNHQVLQSSHTVVSNASCTTNCLAPLAKIIHERWGIQGGLMNTIHSYTNDQVLIDVYHTDLRRARSATHSMIPTKTGAAAAIGLILPELDGKLDGFSIRVPTINVSVVDFTFIAAKPIDVASLNQAFLEASQGPMGKILAYNTLPLVSVDFNHNPASSVFDATQTKVSGALVKVLAWYDNEWGFSNRMLDTALAMMAAK